MLDFIKSVILWVFLSAIVISLMVGCMVLGFVAGTDTSQNLGSEISILELRLGFAEEAINQRVPNCPEDSVLVGIGQFEDGQWDSYECGPALDDFEGYNETT